MSLDFDAMRKKLSQLQGQNRRSNALWRPPAGKSVIRIVPWVERPENPFIELQFHYLGSRTQISPLSFGRPDPIFEFAKKLRQTGDRDDWQMSKKFIPKTRTFAPVIVRGEEEEGVRFYGFGKTVYEELLGVINDPEWGDITDPKKGRDVTLVYIPKEESDTNFAKTKVRASPKITPLTEDAEQMEKFLTEQPDIYQVYDEPSYEDLEKFLERYLGGDSSTTVSERSPSAVPSTDDDSEEDDSDDEDDSFSADNVESEFEALFNQ